MRLWWSPTNKTRVLEKLCRERKFNKVLLGLLVWLRCCLGGTLLWSKMKMKQINTQDCSHTLRCYANVATAGSGESGAAGMVCCLSQHAAGGQNNLWSKHTTLPGSVQPDNLSDERHFMTFRTRKLNNYVSNFKLNDLITPLNERRSLTSKVSVRWKDSLKTS